MITVGAGWHCFLLDKSLGSSVSRWDVANISVFDLFRKFLLVRRLIVLPQGAFRQAEADFKL